MRDEEIAAVRERAKLRDVTDDKCPKCSAHLAPHQTFPDTAWWCGACGIGGDVFVWLMEKNPHLTFGEAVRLVQEKK